MDKANRIKRLPPLPAKWGKVRKVKRVQHAGPDDWCEIHRDYCNAEKEG